MAAIIYPSSTAAPAPRDRPHAPSHQPTRPVRRRPDHLRVIEGGRSARSMVKVYRRRRLVAALMTIAVVIVTVIAVSRIMDAVVDTTTPTSSAAASVVSSGADNVIVVQQGDTLSSIARRLQPAGSTAALVDRLAAAHGPGPLLAGDRLSIASTLP